jgi:hypothetical protein
MTLGYLNKYFHGILDTFNLKYSTHFPENIISLKSKMHNKNNLRNLLMVFHYYYYLLIVHVSTTGGMIQI